MLREYGQQLLLDMNGDGKGNLKQIAKALDGLKDLAKEYRKEHGEYPKMSPTQIWVHRHMCVGDYDASLRSNLTYCEFDPENREITSIHDCPYEDILEVNIVAVFDTDEPLVTHALLEQGEDLPEGRKVPTPAPKRSNA